MRSYLSGHTPARLSGVALMLMLLFSISSSQPVDWRSWPARTYTPRNYDVLHYRIELRFDHPKKQFFGTTTITLVALEDHPQTLTFDAEVFAVRSVRLSGVTPLPFVQNPGDVRVDIGGESRRLDTLRLTFDYDGTQIDIDPVRWGVGKDYHIGLEFFDSTEAHPPLISSISFPEGARHFFPSNDHPSDKASQELILEVPAHWKAASNGSLVGVRPTSSGTAKWHWSLQEPHSTYLAVLAAGPYVVLRDSLGPLELNYWVYPQHVPDAMRSFERTPEIMAFFERVYGVPYPWKKYDQILIPGIGGGAESTTSTVLGQSTVHDARAEQDFPSHWLVAHEAAHQWWGDLVTFKDWGDTWINESFATYGEYLYSRWSLGDDEGMMNLNDKREQYFREARNRYRRPIVMDRWKFPNDNFDSHTYPKGANVLHMLRTEIGDPAFFAFLKKVLTTHAFGNATTDDMRAAAEATSGRSLKEFFGQWLLSPGHPVFNVSWRWDESERKAYLRVEQVQDTTGGIPIYRMPVDIGIRTSAGLVRQRIEVRQRVEEFALQTVERPRLVEFDEPHDRLVEVTFLRPPEELAVQLNEGNALSRVFAAAELAPHADQPAVVSHLKRAATEDPFWAVRRAAVAALGSKGSSAQTSFLQERMDDKISKVRAAAVRALAALKSQALVPFLRERFVREDSYVVQAEIVRAIGAMKLREQKAFLESAAGMKSPRDIIRNAALEGMKALEAL
jgi:aminopeptidase N